MGRATLFDQKCDGCIESSVIFGWERSAPRGRPLLSIKKAMVLLNLVLFLDGSEVTRWDGSLFSVKNATIVLNLACFFLDENEVPRWDGPYFSAKNAMHVLDLV